MCVAGVLDGCGTCLPLDISVQADGRHIVLRVNGELDHSTHEALVDALSALPAADAVLVVVDLAACAFVGVRPFGDLTWAATRLRRRGATLVVRDPPPSFRTLNALLGDPFGLGYAVP